MANTIDPSLLLKTERTSVKKTGSDVLGKDDFLKILMSQLQHQDPLNPMQDKDFIAQMATFSTLEQITNMGKSIDSFVNLEQQNKMVSYNQFVGKEITWHKVSESGTEGEPLIENGSGRVSSIQFKENKVLFVLEDGTELEPGNVSGINEIASETQMLQASSMIGKTVSYLNSSNEDSAGVIRSVTFKGGKIQFQLDGDDAVSITGSQITKIA